MFGLVIVLISVSVTIVVFTLFTLFRTVAAQNQFLLTSYVDRQMVIFEQILYDQPDWQVADRMTVLKRVYNQFQRHSMPRSSSDGHFQLVAQKDDVIYWFVGEDEVLAQPIYELHDDIVIDAVAGRSGVVSFDDPAQEAYVTVYAGLEDWELGFILTVSLEEIRNPFIDSAIMAIMAAAILTSIGGLVFYDLSRPIITNLEENELKYRTLFEGANEGVLLIGDDVVECNDRAAQILGLQKWRLFGMALASFNDPNRSLVNLQAYLHAAHTGRPQYFIWHAQSADKRLIDLEVMMRQIRLDERSLVLTTLVDITERRKAERELAKAEEAVRDSRDHLAHVTRLNTMGEMAAGIAHEINQPLSAISTYAQASDSMLEEPEFDRSLLSHALKEISKQALRAGEVIKRLRNFVNKTEVELAYIDPALLVRESINLATVDARAYAIPLVKEIPDGLPEVKVDAVQIQQVLLNLIRNALEEVWRVNKDAGLLRIVVEEIEQDISIKVIDNGPGIPEDKLERIFHPFFTTKEDGMGIGLAISESIIHGHKGTLKA